MPYFGTIPIGIVVAVQLGRKSTAPDIWRLDRWILELLKERCWDAPNVHSYAAIISTNKARTTDSTMIHMRRLDL